MNGRRTIPKPPQSGGVRAGHTPKIQLSIGENRPTRIAYLDPDSTITTVTGQVFRPKLDFHGNPIIRPTRKGDYFHVRGTNRVYHCLGDPVFLGLHRQILELVPQETS